MHYLCSKNKGADQLHGYRVFVFAYAKIRFSHDAALLIHNNLTVHIQELNLEEFTIV